MKFQYLLCLAFLLAVAMPGITQAKVSRTRQVPAFVGSPAKDKAAFKSFIIKNIGKKVHLKLTFDSDEPHAVKSEYGDPGFNVEKFTYGFVCGGKVEALWTNRCKGFTWDPATRTISGDFRVTEPNPRSLRTNRHFDLMPSK